jgi:hypothetical protein
MALTAKQQAVVRILIEIIKGNPEYVKVSK